MAGDATFGEAPTFSTDVAFSLDLSPDKKAFTATFSGIEAAIDGKSASPIATRVFSFSLPLSCAEPGQNIPFFVSGFVFSEKEAAAHVVFSVNNQTTVTDFRPTRIPISSSSSTTQPGMRQTAGSPSFFSQNGIRIQIPRST